MFYYLILLVVILSLGMIYKSYEFFTNPEYKQFINFELTKKPYLAPSSTYLWWKYFFIPYLRWFYRDCGKYGCSNQINNGYTAQPLINGGANNKVNIADLDLCMNSEYYINSECYCRKNPEDLRCPNNWLTHRLHATSCAPHFSS